MVKEVLEIKNERNLDTLTGVERSKIQKDTLVASGTEGAGSMVYLFSVQNKSLERLAVYVTPSNFELSSARIFTLNTDIDEPRLLKQSVKFPEDTLDELSAKFLEALRSSPEPLETIDYRAGKQQFPMIRHIFKNNCEYTLRQTIYELR